jgi:transcriptional regulator with XRE-family HTH domain
MTITILFGKNVRKFRLSQGLSQDALAEKARLHRTYIGAVERGERNITLINAEKIANALGINLLDCLKKLEEDVEPK